ncbi:hypothetical protein I5907_10850 [Panacibacter sp. DH6]|uniref:Uncharacterized protein n=1 Tax=Panacibacter microcysteis TaxID=2793269 RepID=A0A931GYM2_9BACT|nr:choice-of-anchor X domain-containing protein [Panacibacter microcysteis]MBG9376737.1 hypothetical protein [Panacibacter microcysteis]
MRKSKQVLVLIIITAAILTTTAWNRTGKSKPSYNPAAFNEAVNNIMQNESMLAAMLADESDFTAGVDKAPPAQDVLVQKIPGDNQHLLIMAVYSFADYSGQAIKVDYGGNYVVLKDDGTNDDKVAGDGIFTARISTDVSLFRKEALRLDKEMRQDKYQVQFTGREMKKREDCLVEPFETQKLDANQPVSIANLIGGTNNLIDSVRANCIFITDLSVVEDPARTWNYCTQTGNVNGAWTFKTIMKNLAKTKSTTDPTDAELSTFVRNWLNSWTVRKIINGDTVPARALITQKIINPWLTKSSNAGAPQGQLDMRFAPFKLTSIVNRFDIRERAAGIPAGEGRFTFCAIASDCSRPLEMTFVVEYGIPKPNDCDSLQNWALQWFNLKNFTLGSSQYNAALQAITDQFALWGTGNRAGNTSLNSIRTNEREFAPTNAPRRWEFREFGLIGSPRSLTQRKVAQIPQDKYNAQVDNPDVRAMVDWVNANKAGINKDNYTVPDTLTGGKFFLGGHNQILDTPVGVPIQPYHWDGVQETGPARITNTTTRHVFSLNTCTGCHAGEVQTFFTHVDPVMFGTKATLSGFLAGTAGRGGAVDFDNNPSNDSMMIKDAANRGGAANSVRMFNDILRRAKDLKDFALSPPCAALSVFAIRNELMFKPVHAVH